MKVILNLDAEFPLDWDKWQSWWKAFQPTFNKIATPLSGRSGNFPVEKSYMADEIMGEWTVGDVFVELSEVTFGPRRMIGITLAKANGDTWTPEHGIVGSFTELIQEMERLK